MRPLSCAIAAAAVCHCQCTSVRGTPFCGLANPFRKSAREPLHIVSLRMLSDNITSQEYWALFLQQTRRGKGNTPPLPMRQQPVPLYKEATSVLFMSTAIDARRFSLCADGNKWVQDR